MQGSVRRALVTLASAGLIAALLSAGAPTAFAGSDQTYLVLYRATAVPTDAGSKVTRAGGQLIASYGAIGVAVARSSSPTFKSTLERDARVAAVAATAGNGFQLRDDPAPNDETADPATPAAGSDSEPLAGLQWDMAQIHAFEAHDINGGSSDVVVGDIDTGLDFTHPDLAPNYSAGNSTDCTSGAPAPLNVGNDANGHGTHTAGTIAAAVNGIGIAGVAPNVKIAGIKAGNDSGFFFPEAVVCAFVWAGSHHIDVTNNSYFADPWLFNCKNDKAQKAIYSAEQRAIRYAMSQGTVVVAAAGNQADDLAHPTADATSPDDTTPVVRDITNACAVVPTEVPGVVGVSATGNTGIKSFYSSYGVGAVDVAAPGGDSRLGITAAAPNGRVLSTFPAALPCARKVVDVSGATYCYLQGTSMASPHVAGVAALVRSVHPGWSAGAVSAQLGSTADPLACPPDLSIYAFFPALDNGAPQTCTGGAGATSFYGKGQVNALAALK